MIYFKDGTHLNQVHFVFAGTSFGWVKDDIIFLLERQMFKAKITDGMVTFLGRWRQCCVTKEKCEEFYQKGGSIGNLATEIGNFETKTSIGNGRGFNLNAYKLFIGYK